MRVGKREILGTLSVSGNAVLSGDLDQRDIDRLDTNILLLGFYRSIDNSKAIYNLQDGFVDEYEDETGIDTSASTEEQYDSTDDFYEPSPASSSGTVLTSHETDNNGSAIGDIAGNEYRPAQTFQVSTSDYIYSVEIKLGNHAYTPNFSGDITCRIETDNAGQPSGTLVHANATDTITPVINSWNSFIFTPFKIQANTTYWIRMSCDNQATNAIHIIRCDNTESYTNGQLYTSINGGTFNDTDNDLVFIVNSASRNNMSLQSVAKTAQSAPTEARLVLFEEDISSVTLNTDLKAYASRDNGTTWSQITLANEGSYESSKSILAGSVDVSGQPSGTNMKYKITTHNNKVVKIHGAGMNWDG